MQGKVCVVTGGFGALGRSVASKLLARGATVARLDKTHASSDGLPKTFDLAGVDIADQSAAGRAVQAVVDRHGGIDVLVNVAGGFIWQTLENGGLDTWKHMYEMNVATTVAMTKAALPHLSKRSGAAIINIAANAAVGPASAGMGAYAAAKAAVIRLTESLADELKARDVTVNAILPNIIDTPRNREDMPGANFSEWVRPESLAEIVLFLASPAARVISGASIPVSRGG